MASTAVILNFVIIII